MQASTPGIDPIPPSPSLVVFGLTAVLFVSSSVASVVTLFVAWRAIEDAMVGWLVLGTLFGTPFVGFLGATAVDADRRIGRPARAAWWLVAWGLGVMAHWAPIAVWPIVLFAAAVVEPGRFEQHSIDALWSMGALAGVGIGLAMVHYGRRQLTRPLRRMLPVAERPRNGVVASVWSGVTIAWASATASMVWIALMIEHGWQVGGLAWLSAWAIGTAAVATTFGGWLATIGCSTDDALRGTGSAMVGQAIVPFVFALSPALARDPELQYAYLFVTTILATGGAFLWGYARPVHVTSAAGSAG